jgi:uncharacterized protein YndB with AHSA1/START domain
MMTMAEMSRIDKSIEIAAPPERVWRALTSVKELSEWFRMSIEGEIAAGRELWMTSTEPGEYQGMRFVVKIVEMTPPRRFVWQWHPGAVDPTFDYSKEPRTTVTFTLEPSGGGTRLSVSETGFDALALERRAKAYKDNTQGWNEVLVWLQKHAEKTN